MTMTAPDELRRWIFTPKGAVQFKTSGSSMTIGALKCLGARASTNVSFDIPAGFLEPKDKTPTHVSLKLDAGKWVSETGTQVDMNNPKIGDLAKDAVEKARDRINGKLLSPLDIHLGLATMFPKYSVSHATNRPAETPNLRSWRRADAAWVNARIALPETDETQRDTFDRAFELVEQLDRPVPMQWVYFGHHDGAHRVALRVKKQLRNPIVALKAVKTALFVDRSLCVGPVDARRLIVGTHIMALVQSLRRYGGVSLGNLEVGAYEVEDFGSEEDGKHILSLQVAPSAWGTGVGQASRMKMKELLGAPPTGLEFAEPTGGPAAEIPEQPAQTDEDREERLREAQVLARIEREIREAPKLNAKAPETTKRDPISSRQNLAERGPIKGGGGWTPKGQNAQVAGRDIGGMIYVGTPPRVNEYGYRDKCRAYIDPAARVAAVGGDIDGAGMPYWPDYSDISPVCRATYLDWLQGGRTDGRYNAGYMFLYFYGLERRFFTDKPELSEKLEIIHEVERLAEIYAENGSARRYLNEFIHVARTTFAPFDELKPIFDAAGWDIPYSVKVAIGTRLARGEALSVDWVLSWFMAHPERRLRTAATRCAAEFDALFRLRFEERFPNGMSVTKPRKVLKARYESASGEFSVELEPTDNATPVPDISGLRKPIQTAQDIADQVMQELDKFSRFLGRSSEARGSLAAQALLPAALWPLFPSDALDALKAWAHGIIGQGGGARIDEVVERLTGEVPEKLSKRHLNEVADALGRIGVGFAPDPRFALRAPALGEPVVLFDLGEVVEQLEEVSQTYRAALVELALATFIAQADEQVTQDEHAHLIERINAAALSNQETRRLRANLAWLLSVPADIGLLRRNLKNTDPDQQVSIRAALVAAAHADGVIKPQEVQGIEAVYKTLGLDPALVYSDLHAGPETDGPVRVRAAQSGSDGEAIPKDASSPPASVQALDAERIAAIRDDTARVSEVLGGIFADDTPDEIPTTKESAAIAGLTENLTRLVEAVIERTHWSEAEFNELCQGLDLMASGALEAVNEWAFETFDDALLDEYDGYDVAEAIAAAIKVDLGKGQ